MPVSCHFQGCKALLRILKRRYIKYHAFAFAFLHIIWSHDPRNPMIFAPARIYIPQGCHICEPVTGFRMKNVPYIAVETLLRRGF